MNKFFLPILFVVLAVGLFFMYIDPQWQTVQQLRASNAEYDKAIAQSKQLLQVRDGLLKKYNGFRGEDLTRLEKLLPNNIDNVRLIIDINSITSKYGAAIKNVKLSTADGSDSKSNSTTNTPPGGSAASPSASPTTINSIALSPSQSYNSMILSFTITAPYSTFITILQDLERSLRLLDVTSVSFKAGDSEPYDYNVSIRTYWLK